jgi:hypothetical protein
MLTLGSRNSCAVSDIFSFPLVIPEAESPDLFRSITELGANLDSWMMLCTRLINYKGVNELQSDVEKGGNIALMRRKCSLQAEVDAEGLMWLGPRCRCDCVNQTHGKSSSM